MLLIAIAIEFWDNAHRIPLIAIAIKFWDDV
jgi:hypothetical protein